MDYTYCMDSVLGGYDFIIKHRNLTYRKYNLCRSTAFTI